MKPAFYNSSPLPFLVSFFGHCASQHSHPSCSFLLAQQLISPRRSPSHGIPFFFSLAPWNQRHLLGSSESLHANTECFVFCSVALCLIPFPESLSYFSGSGLVPSCQHPFSWEPVNKQRRACAHPLSCFCHIFLCHTLGVPSSMTHHGVDGRLHQSGSRNEGKKKHVLTASSPASPNLCKYFLLRPFPCCAPKPVCQNERNENPPRSEQVRDLGSNPAGASPAQVAPGIS